MTTDIKHAGALAGVERFGVPWHGYIENPGTGGVLHTGKLDASGNEVTRPWPMSAYSNDCYLVQVPGLADPYAGTEGALRKASDALEGKEYTTWAIVSGIGYAFGRYIGDAEIGGQAWIWIDANNTPWSITYDEPVGGITYGSTSLRFVVTRFGDLRITDPAIGPVPDTYSIQSNLFDTGQATPNLGTSLETGRIVVEDVAVNGGKVLFAISSDSGLVKKLGFIEAVFSIGAGGIPEVTATLICNRLTAIGTASGTETTTSVTTGTCTGAPDDSFTTTTTHETNTSQINRIVGYLYNSSGTPAPLMLSFETQSFKHETAATQPDGSIWIEYWEGPGSSSTILSYGASQLSAGSTTPEVLTQAFTAGTVCQGYVPDGTTTTVDLSAYTGDQAYLGLYELPSPTTGSGDFYPYRQTSKVYTAHSRADQSTFGAIYPGGINATTSAVFVNAAYNPATEELFYPLSAVRHFA